MSIDFGCVAAPTGRCSSALSAVLVVKAVVTGAAAAPQRRPAGVAAETGVLMASPSETTLIVLGAAAAAGLIAPRDAAFWQIVTALGLTVTPLLASSAAGARPPVEQGGELPKRSQTATAPQP